MSWTYLVYILAIALAFSSVGGVLAEDSTDNGDVETPTSVVTQEPPPVDPVPEQPPSQQPPTEPAPEQPPADEVPTEPVPVPPTEEVPTEPATEESTVEVPPVNEETPVSTETTEPEPEVTEEPGNDEASPGTNGDSTPTPEPTVEPTSEPTEEPSPVITWSQSRPVTCELRDGEDAGLKYAESRTYHCEVTARVGSDLAMPADMQIEWHLDVHFPDSYHLQFPDGSQASITEQLPGSSANATTYTIAHPWSQSGEQAFDFELVVTRNTCAIGKQVLTVQAVPELRTPASEATIVRQEGNIHPDPAKLVSPVIDADAPTVAFDGVISFEALSATSTGLQSNTSRGTATIIVTGEWDPCTTWTVDLGGAVDVPTETPAQLRATSINEEPVSGEACDLADGCDVIVLPAIGDAASPLEYTIGLELQLHENTPVGSFGIDLHTEINGEGIQP